MFATTITIAGVDIALRVFGPFDVTRFRYRFGVFERPMPPAMASHKLCLTIDRSAWRLEARDAPYPALKAYRSDLGTKLVRADLSLFLANKGVSYAYARGPARFPALPFDQDGGEADTPLRVLTTHALQRGGRGALAHACGLRLDGLDGVLVLGQSGAGKTTTARLFRGHDVLSDDQTAVLYGPSHDAFRVASTPFVGMYGRTMQPCEAPLRAIVALDRLHQGDLARLTTTQTRAAILACLPLYDRSNEGARAALTLADALASHVPCFTGAPRLDEGAEGFCAQLERALATPRA